MAAFLSKEWLDLYRSAHVDLPERPGVSGTLQIVVAGTPDGDVSYTQRIEDGRVIEATLAADGEPDVVLTHGHADAVAIARGELSLPVGFMQGRVKMVGSTGALMALLPVLQSDEHRAAVAAVAAQTDL